MRRINYQLPAGPFIVRSNARKTRLAPLAALLLMLAFLHPPGAAAQAWPWTSYPTFFPSETNIALHTLPDEIATGQSMMVQFMAINYTTQDWTAATAHLAVTQDTAGLFPSQRIDLPDGVIVSFIRQGRFTTTITAPAQEQDATVTLQMAASDGTPIGLALTRTIRVRAHGLTLAQNLKFSSPVIYSGITAQLSATVTNNSDVTLPPQALQFWLSPDPTFWATRDPAQAGWQLTAPAGAGPSPRNTAAMAYDPLSGKFIMFGGNNDGGSIDDGTWEYTPPSDSTAGSWRNLNIPGPPARNGHCMATDLRRGVIVLFGGLGSGAMLNDTWEYRSDQGWTQINTATAPTRRERAQMVYDEARGKIMLVGGQDGAPESDIWEYNGTNWTLIPTATTPPGRANFGLAYDSRRDRIIMLGGRGFGKVGDMWAYSPGGDWTSIPVGTLPAHEGQAMFYDPKRDRLVMFGGLDTIDYRGETMEWRDATGWRIVPTLGPATREQAAAAYDPVRGRLVLFGGWDSYYLGDTWELPCGGVGRALGEVDVGTLAPGQSQDVSLTLNGSTLGIPGKLVPGNYWIGLIPDAQGTASDAPQPAGAFVFPSQLSVQLRNAARRWWLYE